MFWWFCRESIRLRKLKLIMNAFTVFFTLLMAALCYCESPSQEPQTEIRQQSKSELDSDSLETAESSWLGYNGGLGAFLGNYGGYQAYITPTNPVRFVGHANYYPKYIGGYFPGQSSGYYPIYGGYAHGGGYGGLGGFGGCGGHGKYGGNVGYGGNGKGFGGHGKLW